MVTKFDILKILHIKNHRESFAPILELESRETGFKIKCSCGLRSSFKCKEHAKIKNHRGKLMKLNTSKKNGRTIPDYLKDYLMYYLNSNLMYFIKGVDKNIISKTSVTELTYRNSWSRSMYELQLGALFETMASKFQYLFLMSKNLINCTVYYFSIGLSNYIPFDININAYLPNIPIINLNNPLNIKLVAFGMIILAPLRVNSAEIPSYVSGVGEHNTGVKMTFYWVDYPGDFKKSSKELDFGSCDGDVFGSADVNFLKNMALDGTGVVNNTLYNLGSCDCNGRYFCFEEVDLDKHPYGISSTGTALEPFITIASNDFPEGFLFVPTVVGWPIPGTNMKHNGCFKVEDTGYSLGNKHIDVFVLRMKFYNYWDDLYESPDVETYTVEKCTILDYANALKSGGKMYSNAVQDNSDNDNNLSTTNSSKTLNGSNSDKTCLVWSNSTSTSKNNSGNNNSTSSNIGNSTTSTNTTAVAGSKTVTVLVPSVTVLNKRENFVKPRDLDEIYGFEKRSSVARLQSCSGYNCYPVHVILITGTVFSAVCYVVSVLVKQRAPGLVWILFTLSTIFTVSTSIYNIIALKSVGPVKIAIVDTGSNYVKRTLPDLNNQACANKSLQYVIIMALGGALDLIGIVLMFKLKKYKLTHIRVHTARYTSIVFNLTCIAFGTTILALSFLVYLGYQKCFRGDHLKLLCNIAGHMFWGTVVTTVSAFVLVVLHTIIQFFSLSMFIAKLDVVRPVVGILFGVILISTLVYIDGSSCF